PLSEDELPVLSAKSVSSTHPPASSCFLPVFSSLRPVLPFLFVSERSVLPSPPSDCSPPSPHGLFPSRQLGPLSWPGGELLPGLASDLWCSLSCAVTGSLHAEADSLPPAASHGPAADPVEEVLYSEIKRHGEKPPSQSIPEPTVEAAASRTPSYRTAIACLGLLCVLLLAGVVGMSVFNIIQVSQHRTTLELYTNESTAHSKLKTETAALEKEKEELTVQRNQFNNTLRSIIQFPTFPVRAFCQIRDREIHCEPCMMNWIQNGSSCYLFYNGYDWKSWENSRQYCVGMGGDLAIIDSREEQEFIMQNSPFYYDIYHGYWIGLYKNPEVWKWTTGTKLNDG
uniref:C-type lectin domain family 9 member A-like n=1 Tax=Astyanax mexicanus TaxID=7994 RepID=A0A3B1JJS6_ASTMX